MEVLSPVGNIDSLYAAIEAGCDAVYLGGKSFGARAFASNFTNDELINVINIAHLYKVKVYVTVNTLIFEDEISSFMEYIDFLHKNNVDAIIIQDIGMLSLVHQTYPNLEIHASTQMHIHNLEGAKLVEKLGVKRVVLARETEIELIKEIKENTNLEVEIFVLGALCVSYSGQCLMSSLIGNRSGNRGSCVQCCRKEYDLVDKDSKKYNKDKYLLSMKDLNTLDYIEELANIGVDSLKIEGRMKSSEYVFLATSLVRKSLTSKITDKDINDLKKIFNRTFTKGYMFHDYDVINEYRPNHMGVMIGKVINGKIHLSSDVSQGDGIRIVGKKDTGLILNYIYKNGKLVNKAYSGDVIKTKADLEDGIVLKTLDKNLIDEINSKIKAKKRKILIDIKVEAKINKKIKIYIYDKVIEGEFIIQNAVSNPVTFEEIKEKISKLGNSVYEINNISLDMDNNIFIPIKDLNEVKRKLILTLDNMNYKNNYVKKEYNISLQDYEHKREKTVLVENQNQVLFRNNIIYSKEYFKDSILKLPRVIEHHKDYNQELLVGELGSVNKYKDIITDFSLNVTNSYSVALLHSLGVKRITLSVELDFDRTKKLIEAYENRYKKHPNLEVIVYGNIESMITKYDILSKYNLEGNYYLRDSYKYLYPLRKENNKTIIYHYEKRKIENIDDYYNIGINYLRYQIIDTEDIKYVKEHL